jgi:hypothetical protein
MNKQGQWLQTVLLRELGPVEAPTELWDRVRIGPGAGPRDTRSPMVWMLAAAVAIVIAVLAVRARERPLPVLANASRREFQSGDPAQIRAWLNAQAGIDVALPAVLQPSVRLIGASVVNRVEPAVQVVYRVGDREASLLVEKTSHPEGAGAGGARHADLRADPNGKITWVMRGQMYTLACFGPGRAGQPGGLGQAGGLRHEDARVACLLCHA